MFSGFNTARKAAWLKLTRLECANDRKDSQMLLRSIRESKRNFEKIYQKLYYMSVHAVKFSVFVRHKEYIS